MANPTTFDRDSEIARLKGELSAATWAIALLFTGAGKTPEDRSFIIRKIESASARDIPEDLVREGADRFKRRLLNHLQDTFSKSGHQQVLESN